MPNVDDSGDLDRLRASIEDTGWAVYAYIDKPPSGEGCDVALDVAAEAARVRVHRFASRAGMGEWIGSQRPRGVIWRRRDRRPWKLLYAEVEDYAAVIALIDQAQGNG